MKKIDFIFIVFTILLAAILRPDILIANNFVIDSDEAIVGLMAKHISEGQKIPVFYYGQHYMGSLEAIFASIVFKVFGISSVALKIVPFAFSLILVIAIYDLSLIAINRRAARIAALLCAIAPSALIVWSSTARGGFIELIVIGTLSFCLLARWLKQEHSGELLIVGQGLLLGVGWWVNNQIIYFMIPTAIAITGKIIYRPRPYLSMTLHNLFKAAFVGSISWLVGSMPFWIYNIENNWASFGMFSSAGEGQILRHISGFYHQALPIILGGSRFWQAQDIYPGSVAIVTVIFSILLFILVSIRIKPIIAALRLNFGSSSMPEVLMLFLISCAAVFIFSSFGWLSQAPRYLLPMYAGIFPLLALVLDKIGRFSKFIGHFLFALILLINIASSYFGGRSVPGEPVVFKGDRVAKSQKELIAWLERENIDLVRTNYWIGYRLAFETAEKTRFLIAGEPSQVRIREWQDLAYKYDLYSLPFIAVPAQAKYIRKALQLLHIEYEETTLSDYHVFHNLDPIRVSTRKIDQQNFTISANYKSEQADMAVDQNLLTRWGSGEAQKPDMQIQIDFKQITNLAGITYKLGTFTSDFPRALQIEFILADGGRQLYFAEEGWHSIRNFLEFSSELPLFFQAQPVRSVILKQTGKDAVFDWSVAELEFFEVSK